MRKVPKHMLIELPTADEIDGIAITSPKFEVRQLSIEMGDEKANLDYTPCKGQMIVVIRGEGGISLVRKRGANDWTLPSDRIGPNEEIVKSVKRVGREQCGLMLKSIELAGMYDVVWHYSNVSIKRLHFVYVGETDDRECSPQKTADVEEARFFRDLPDKVRKDRICSCALTDSSAK